MSISSIKKALKSVFQGILKNLVSLADDSPLDNHLKPLKIGNKTTNIELSEDEVCYKGKELVSGDIEGTGIKSTGETGGTKFLREDGDGTCSWQTAGGGGSSEYYIQTAGRARCQYNNWYYATHIAYGNYFYWYYTTSSTSLPVAYDDSYNPSYLVPKAGNIIGYTIIGNVNTTDTIEWALMKGTQPTFGSAGNWSLSQVGATQSAGGTANIQYKWEQTGLSVSVAKNDMIMPYFRRTTDNDSTYVYIECAINIIIEGS
jgi:hypothetical protein